MKETTYEIIKIVGASIIIVLTVILLTVAFLKWAEPENHCEDAGAERLQAYGSECYKIIGDEYILGEAHKINDEWVFIKGGGRR